MYRANPGNPFFSRICAGSTLCRRMSFIDDSRIGVLHAVATEEDGRGPNGSTGASTSQSLRKTKYGHSHIHDFFLAPILLLKTYISITNLMFERGNANGRNGRGRLLDTSSTYISLQSNDFEYICYKTCEQYIVQLWPYFIKLH